MNRAWMTDAACRGADPKLFFFDEDRLSNRARLRDALALCRSCPVTDACREYALTIPDVYGVWGGMREDELRSLRRRRYRAAFKARQQDGGAS